MRTRLMLSESRVGGWLAGHIQPVYRLEKGWFEHTPLIP